MSALAADFFGWKVCRGTGELEVQQPATGADTFYFGSIGNITINTGTFELANADADQFAGIVNQHTVVTAAAQLVRTWAPRGVVWFTGVSAIATANVGDLLAATAASDNPADLTPQTSGTTGAVGRCIAVEVTAVSGYVDLADRFLVANA